MILKEPTKCCGAKLLVWIRGKDYFMCPCGKTRINDRGREVGTKVFNRFKSPGRPKKRPDGALPLPKVREDEMDAESWE